MGFRLRLAVPAVLSIVLAASAASPPVKLDGLSVQDFAKLPAEASLDLGGRVVTKAQFLSEVQSKSPEAAETAPKADLGAAQAKLDADEKALVDAAGSKVRAGWASVSPRESLPPVQAAPRIVSVEPQPIRHGGDMTIRGSGFGEGVGEVHLMGPFPGGHLTLPVCAGGGWGIVSCAWRSGVVSTVGTSWGGPKVTGIPDSTLQVVIVTKKGERSAPFPVAFRAKQVLRRLTLKDVEVARSNPAEGACTSGEHGATVECGEGWNDQPPTKWHVGVDRITAKVRNGWTFDSRSSARTGWRSTGYTEARESYGDPVVRIRPSGFEVPLFAIGADRTTAEAVCTYVSFAEYRWCSVDLLVIGPEDVPFR